MTAARYDVIGIGNAIVDIIGRCDEAYLAKIGAAKGSMRLVGANEIKKIYTTMGPAVEISGGSAANTIAGVASFGGKAAFIGTIADDEFGKIFAHDIRSIGVAFDVAPIADAAPTSRSLILVTPDGERTMNTFLGISTHLNEDQLKLDLIRDAEILYLEGYLFDEPQAKQAFRKALQTAKSADRKVALTLSDGFCVDRHRDASGLIPSTCRWPNSSASQAAIQTVDAHRLLKSHSSQLIGGSSGRRVPLGGPASFEK